MKAVVIGGSGFIGTRLCDRLANEQVPFLIVDKKQSLSYPSYTKLGDVRSLEKLREVVPESNFIINLAAEHRDDVKPKSLYDEVNVGGAKNISQVAREKGINTMVFTSSVAVYGFAPVGTGESGELCPFHDYGRTKMEAETVYKDWQKEDREHRTLVVVRPTVVFGERNRGNVYNLLKQITSGRFAMVGKGDNIKSMAYVENVAAFSAVLAGFPIGHTYI